MLVKIEDIQEQIGDGKTKNVEVGINAELESGEVSIYSDNTDLKRGQNILLTNRHNQSCPTLKLYVSSVVDREEELQQSDKVHGKKKSKESSVAQIFISKEDANFFKLINPKNPYKGVYQLSMKKIVNNFN
jgi:hypothetical protein